MFKPIKLYLTLLMPLMTSLAFGQANCEITFSNGATTQASLKQSNSAKKELQDLLREYHQTTNPIGRKLLQKNIDTILTKIRSEEPGFKITHSTHKPLDTANNNIEAKQRVEESKYLNLPSEFRETKSELRMREELADVNPQLNHKVISMAGQDLGSARNQLHFINTREHNFIELQHPKSKWLPFVSEKKFFLNLRHDENHRQEKLLFLKDFTFANPTTVKFFTTQDRKHLLVADAESLKLYSVDLNQNSVNGKSPLRDLTSLVGIPGGSIASLAISDDLMFLTYHSQRQLHLIDLKTNKSSQRYVHDSPLLKFSPNGKSLVMFASGHTRIFDLTKETLDSNAFYYNFSHMGHFDQHILWTTNNRYVAVIVPGAIENFSFFIFDTILQKSIDFDDHSKFHISEAKALSARWNPQQDALSIVASSKSEANFFLFKPITAVVFSAPISDMRVKSIQWNSATEFQIFGAQNLDGSGIGSLKFYEVK